MAGIRLAVILFNIAVYWWRLHPQGVPWLALTISLVASAYGAYVLLGAPYRRFPILLTSIWTAATDGVLILLWIHATGDFASPFHLLWYLSLLAITFRYDSRVILATSVAYAAGYTGLLWATGTLAGNGTEVLVRIAYILLLGSLGALLARESLRLFEERFDLRQRMQRMELERLQEVDRFKTDFINTAAHELNTPLTPLLLQVHLLRKHTPQESAGARSVDVLERNLTRLSQLVQDMLDVARLQSGRLRLEPSETDLAKLMRETLETFQHQASDRGVTLRLETGGDLLANVDGRRIGQVLYNLVSNAIKFTPAGGQVTLAGTRAGNELLLQVRDTGIGMTDEQMVQLFQPFSRLHRDQVDSPGTGLGLYISRGLVEGHGGTLESRSEGPGLGTVFSMRIPCKTPLADVPSAAEETPAPNTRKPRSEP